jgi:hypothetical protein
LLIGASFCRSYEIEVEGISQVGGQDGEERHSGTTLFSSKTAAMRLVAALTLAIARSTRPSEWRGKVYYSHIMKTGGSSVVKTIASALSCCEGGASWCISCDSDKFATAEYPDFLQDTFLLRRLRGERNVGVATFREPVARVVSHYYQHKPCPDVKKSEPPLELWKNDEKWLLRLKKENWACRQLAIEGYLPYVRGCPYAHNWQSKYVNSTILEQLDHVILAESLKEDIEPLLAYLGIHHQVQNDKVRAIVGHGGHLAGSAGMKDGERDCTSLWLHRIIKERGFTPSKCSVG